MAVIINEFDVAVESSGQAAATPPSPAAATANGPSVQPQDVESLVRFFESRRTRLVAD